MALSETETMALLMVVDRPHNIRQAPPGFRQQLLTFADMDPPLVTIENSDVTITDAGMAALAEVGP